MRTEYPIADYALIGNCETAALINSEGRIDWLCLPAFDGPSFFGALLDRVKGGEFSLRPADTESGRVERRYLEDSAMLETRFISEGAVVRLLDFFVIARQSKAAFYDFTSLEPTRKLVRLVDLECGARATLECRIVARPDYGRRAAEWHPVEGGFACAEVSLFTNAELSQKGDDLVGTVPLTPGARVHFVLDYAEERTAPDPSALRAWERVTAAFWREWNLFNYYRGPHQRVVRRSAVTLKLLTHAPSGAFVAAPTTSLPEIPGGEANWDYRFTWLRDTALFINTLFRTGYSGEAKAFFEFLCRTCGDAAETEPLPVLLPLRAETVSEEETLAHLDGYGGARPVRVGNRARGQFQLDVYGDLLQSLAFWTHTGGKLDRRKRQLAMRAIEVVRRSWREPDNGIWEEPERRQTSYGKVSAWLAVQRARDLGLIEPATADALAAEIRERVEHSMDGWLPANLDEGDGLDAVALLAYTRGFLEHETGRMTREKIEKTLFEDGWVYRSRAHRGRGEGAFVLCTFWLIEHLIREGETDRAEQLLDRAIAAASPLGLFAEEIVPESGAFLGNFPQAYSHLGLISAILNMDAARRDASFARLPEHEKFKRGVGRTVGVRAVLAGFWRVPRTLKLLFASRSRWRRR